MTHVCDLRRGSSFQFSALARDCRRVLFEESGYDLFPGILHKPFLPLNEIVCTGSVRRAFADPSLHKFHVLRGQASHECRRDGSCFSVLTPFFGDSRGCSLGKSAWRATRSTYPTGYRLALCYSCALSDALSQARSSMSCFSRKQVYVPVSDINKGLIKRIIGQGTCREGVP